jgi:hypothetical protein
VCGLQITNPLDEGVASDPYAYTVPGHSNLTTLTGRLSSASRQDRRLSSSTGRGRSRSPSSQLTSSRGRSSSRSRSPVGLAVNTSDRGFPDDLFDNASFPTLADMAKSPTAAASSATPIPRGSSSRMSGRLPVSGGRRVLTSDSHSQSFHNLPTPSSSHHATPVSLTVTLTPQQLHAPRWTLGGVSPTADPSRSHLVVSPSPGTSVVSLSGVDARNPGLNARSSLRSPVGDEIIRDAFNASLVRGIALKGGISDVSV